MKNRTRDASVNCRRIMPPPLKRQRVELDSDTDEDEIADSDSDDPSYEPDSDGSDGAEIDDEEINSTEE